MISLHINALNRVIYLKGKLTFEWKDDKTTDRLLSVDIIANCADGELKIVLPARKSLLEEIERHYKFGDIISLDDDLDVDDILVSITKDRKLSVKVFADFREGFFK